MNTEGEARYLADEVDLGGGVFAEVVYTYNYQVSGDDVDIVPPLDKMEFKKIVGPEGEDLPLEVSREYENAARDEFWRIFADSAEDQVRERIGLGQISEDF